VSYIRILRGVYSDTTQLNSTQLTQLNSVQPSQSCFCLWRHDLQTESTGSLRSLIGDSCSRCERVDNSTSSWVESCRYKHPFRRVAASTMCGRCLSWCGVRFRGEMCTVYRHQSIAWWFEPRQQRTSWFFLSCVECVNLLVVTSYHRSSCWLQTFLRAEEDDPKWCPPTVTITHIAFWPLERTRAICRVDSLHTGLMLD